MPTIELQPSDDFVKAIDQLPANTELLLPRGVTFDVAKTPTIRRDNIRIGSYGDPALPSPIVRSKSCGGLAANNRKNIVVSGVHFTCSGNPVGHGLSFYKVRNLVLEDLDISGYTFGVVVQGQARGDCVDVAIRRCHLHDNWHPKREHSSGVFVSCTDRLVVEHNLFDTNGWRPDVTKPTDQNHNGYLQSSNGPATVRGNLFLNASGYGLQQRCGGVCEGNVLVDNPVHQSFGLIHGAPGFPGGVSGVVRGNVYVGSRDIGSSPRGWALEFANIKDVEVADLLIAHDRQGNAVAVQVNVPQRVTNSAELVGILDLRIRPTVFVWDWPKGKFWKSKSITASGTGMKQLGKLERPSDWNPPVKADLTAIVSVVGVREMAKTTPLDRLAAELIAACRVACGLVAPEPTPTPVVRLVLRRGPDVVTEDLADGDTVTDDCGIVAQVVTGDVEAVRFFIDGRFVREERTAPFSLGGDEGAERVKPFNFPFGPFVLAVEMLDGAAKVVGRREVALVGATPPDVPGALASAIEARNCLPVDPLAALTKVERVIELLT